MTEITASELVKSKPNVKFYRLTNKKECHRGYQYKDGLNELIEPWVPSGKYNGGGLYFFDETQLIKYEALLVDSKDLYWIREVTFPDDAMIYFYDEHKYKCNKLILGERRKFYISDYVKITRDNYFIVNKIHLKSDEIKIYYPQYI